MENNIVTTVFRDAIVWFESLAKQYRNSGELQNCCEWLQIMIKSLQLLPSVDNYSDNSLLSREKYGNIMFDIPATDSNIEPIILQAHYDMVLVTDDTEYAKKNGIDIVDENINGERVIHSKDYKTSLGADDGTGVAIILSIAQNWKNFKHGAIRCILTADEEIPNGGSKSKTVASWIIYNKLINLDSSVADQIRIGCYGAIETKYVQNFKTIRIDNGIKIYRINISGLVGGHSAGITNSQANAFTLGFNFINLLDSFNLIEFNNLNNKKINAIPTGCEIVFSSTKDEKFLHDLWDSQNYSKLFPQEKNIHFSINTIFKSNQYGINEIDSKNICNFISKIATGVIANDKNGFPISTGNIGRIESFKASNQSQNVTIFSFQRAKTKEELNKIVNINSELAKKYDFDIKHCVIDPIWEAKDKSKLQNIISKTYNRNKTGSKFVVTPAWLEPADFVVARPDLDVVSIGCNSVNCHTKNETLYIDSFETLIRNLLEILSDI